MSSNINNSKINKKKVKTSMIPISSLNPKILRKIAKTPEIMYIKGSDLNSQRLNISNNNLDPISKYQSLTLTKDGNPKNMSNIFYQEYLMTNNKYHQTISEIENLNKKITEGNKKIEKLTENLKKLKEDKKQKQSDIVNLLSNKESLEEIYKNKVSFLIKSKELKSKKDKDNNNDDNNNKYNNNDELKSHFLSDIEAFKIDQEKELEIKVEEIKRSEKKKFIEQVISFVEEIFQGNEEEFCKQIREKINLAYKIFFTEISSTNINEDFIISNFFLRISLFISNHSLGNYSEKNINKFLRYLLKINSIGVLILQVIKFLNKKYKEAKMEIKEQINNLKKRDENYKDKIIMLEKNKEEMKQFIDKNSELFKEMKNTANNTIDEIYWSINVNDLNASNERSIIKKKLSQTSRENKEDFYDDKNYIIINENNGNNTGRKTQELNHKLLSSHGAIRKFIRNRPKLNNEYKRNKIMNDENKDILATSAIINNVINKDNFSSKKLKNTSNKDKVLNISNNDNNHNNINNSDMISNYNSNDSKQGITNNIDSNNNTYTEINDDNNESSKNIRKENKNKMSNVVINDININKYLKNNTEKNEKEDGKIYIVNSNKINDFIKLKPINTKKYYRRKEVNELAMKKNNTSAIDNNIFIKKNINKHLYYKNDINKSLNRENDIINDNNLLSESNMNRTCINDQNLLLNKSNYNIPKKRYNKNIYIINNINNSEQINNNNNIYNREVDKNKDNNIMTITGYINENEEYFKDGIKSYNDSGKNNGKFISKNLNRKMSHKETNENNNKNMVINKLNMNNISHKIPHLKQTSNTPRAYIKINNNEENKDNLITRSEIIHNESKKANYIPRAKKKLTDENLLNKYNKTNSFYGIKSKMYIIPSNKIKVNNKEYRLIKNKTKATTIPISSFIKVNKNNNERNSYNIGMEEKLNKTELSFANNNNKSMNMLSP